mmetsp:Transcript_68510/g.178003  ORF Transcript_68510/g.178003 Transcript_68510/m.178003 type:complete len:120 (-) Transcript_68510:202-561(-)
MRRPPAADDAAEPTTFCFPACPASIASALHLRRRSRSRERDLDLLPPPPPPPPPPRNHQHQQQQQQHQQLHHSHTGQHLAMPMVGGFGSVPNGHVASQGGLGGMGFLASPDVAWRQQQQ